MLFNAALALNADAGERWRLIERATNEHTTQLGLAADLTRGIAGY
jgi:hypothetical protein